jgi:hypothetical protein
MTSLVTVDRLPRSVVTSGGAIAASGSARVGTIAGRLAPTMVTSQALPARSIGAIAAWACVRKRASSEEDNS